MSRNMPARMSVVRAHLRRAGGLPSCKPALASWPAWNTSPRNTGFRSAQDTLLFAVAQTVPKARISAPNGRPRRTDRVDLGPNVNNNKRRKKITRKKQRHRSKSARPNPGRMDPGRTSTSFSSVLQRNEAGSTPQIQEKTRPWNKADWPVFTDYLSKADYRKPAAISMKKLDDYMPS